MKDPVAERFILKRLGKKVALKGEQQKRVGKVENPQARAKKMNLERPRGHICGQDSFA